MHNLPFLTHDLRSLTLFFFFKKADIYKLQRPESGVLRDACQGTITGTVFGSDLKS